MKVPGLIVLNVSAFVLATASAQPLQPEVLFKFQPGPTYPTASLVQCNDGNFYGTSSSGGRYDGGTVFRVTTNGDLTTLVSLFAGNNGAPPVAGLMLGSDGNFYGTTPYGGTNGFGTVFQVTANGKSTTLAAFDDPADEPNRLVFGDDGNFYGTTAFDNGISQPSGTFFRLVTSPRFSSVAKQVDGSLLLNGTGLPNDGYRLWAGTDLSLPFASWTLLTSGSFGTNGTFSFTDAGALTNSSRFYRLSVP